MLFKSCSVKVKAAGESDGLNEGEFEAIVSAFGNKDSYGDVVLKGAFADSLAEWTATGDPIPVYYSHRMDDPDFCIGEVIEAYETDQGLYVKAKIDLDDDAKKAKQVYRLLKGRRVTQFSFAYDVLEGAWIEKADDSYYELRKLKLYEVGPTPVGANQDTELLAVKAASEHAVRFVQSVKAGRVLSAKNETSLRDAHTQLSAAANQIAEVLSAVESDNDQEKNAQPAQPAKSEEPEQAKDEEPTAEGPAKILTLIQLERASQE